MLLSFISALTGGERCSWYSVLFFFTKTSMILGGCDSITSTLSLPAFYYFFFGNIAHRCWEDILVLLVSLS